MIESSFQRVKTEWLAIAEPATPDPERFAALKQEADAIIDAGLWVSGPADMLSVLGRHRDELTHSRMIAWLLTPTGRHGLGRRFLRAVLDHVWPDEHLLASGHVSVEVEWTRAAADEVGALREARADIVVVGEGATIVIENKVDAGEGWEQCERLYWSWATHRTQVRWLFLSPSGRPPVTASSPAAQSAWQALGYAELERLLRATLPPVGEGATAAGRVTAHQYLASVASVVP